MREGPFCVFPLDQMLAGFVAEAHAAGEVKEDIEVSSRLTGRLDSLEGDMHGAVSVGKCTRLLAPHGRRQHYVRQLGGLRQEGVLYNDEQTRLPQRSPDFVQLRKRDSWIGANDPEE